MIQYRVAHNCDAIRAQMEAGSLTPSQFPGYQEHHAGYVCSFDLCSGRAKSGGPISVECTPKFDFDILMQIDTKTQDEYLVHNFEWHFYLLDQLYLKTGSMTGFVKIFDLDKCSMKQVSVVNQWRKVSQARQERLGLNILECYPECFAKVLVVNTPSFFAVLWKLIKPFVPPRTADKVKVESNSKKAKEKMLDLVDAAVLPSFLGGEFAGEWMMK
eukprot:CAMPEP_0179427668 /NCGR_PEP_ID=MMETSP0799-20121207/13541_1 /TAXON_ID=46947 /ORGANISM="Geminigera cryophila, Strain CCMP2564" /LENGTH=214 /DNA_ID=CAMNT_0021202795 /DNA_START=623 /DNA_END=1267 /DNA_ORIENTATION=-